MQKPNKTSRGEQQVRIPFVLKLMAGLVVCLMLVPLALVLALHVPAVQDLILQAAVRKLETSADLQIQLGSSRWSPFHELQLLDLKVKASGVSLLECEAAKVGYRLSLTWPYVHPADIVLERPSLHLERDSHGRWQLPGGKGAASDRSRPAAPFPWSSFPWPQVRIVSGNIAAFQNGQKVLSLRDMNATLSVQEITGSDGPSLKLDFGRWQGAAEIPPWGPWQFTGEAEIRNHTLSSAKAQLSIAEVMQVQGEGNWSLIPPFDGALKIHVGQLSANAVPFFKENAPPLDDISGTLRLERQAGAWSLDHDLKSNLGELQGTLKLDAGLSPGPAIQLNTRFSDLQLPVAALPSDCRLSGHAELTLNGTELETAQARMQTVLETSRWGDQTIQYGKFEVSYGNGTLEIKPSQLQSSLGKFDLSATADLRGLWDLQHSGAAKFELRVDQANLRKVFAGSSQQLGGSIVYNGRYGVGDFRKAERWQGNVEANLVLPPFLTLKASGNQHYDAVNLDYELEVSDLGKIAGFVPAWHGKGKVSSRGSIRGRWPDLVWDGAVNSPAFQVGAVQAEQVSLKGKGKLVGKEAQREVVLKAQNLAVEGRKLGSLNLDLQQEADTCRFSLKSEGMLGQGGAKLSGRLEKIWGPVRTVQVSQSALTWGNQSASVDGKLEVGKEGIRVHSLALHRGSEKMQLAGEVWFDAKTDLKLTFEGINLGQWSRAAGREVPISGVASGQLAMKGRSDQPEASLNLLVQQGTVGVPSKGASASGSAQPDKSVVQEQRIDRFQLQGSLVNGVLTLQGEMRSPTVQTPVHFTGRLPVHLSLNPAQFKVKPGEGINSSVRVTGLQAAGILPYLDFLDRLGGRLDVDVQVGGTLDQPTVAGTGSWDQGSFRVTKWPHPIENIQLGFQADAKQIVIPKSSMELLGGHVQVTGRVGYPRFHEMDFEAEGTDLDVKDIYGIKGKASGQARLLQTASLTRLTGILNLNKGEMNLGELETDLARSISVVDGDGKAEVVEVRKDATRRGSFVDRLEMDLAINLPPSGTWVRGRGLDAEITGTLKLEKRPLAGVKLRGGFQTLRGEYKFQDYKLTIVDGELVFPEAPEPDPHLKIVCQKDVKDAIINVYVTGPLKQPKLTMSSIPSMNQVDILSYLLFDRPAGDLSSKESFQLQDKAATWMGSQTSALLKRVIGDTWLTPDTIEYRKSTGISRSATSSGNRTEATVVSVGKHITPDLYINFEKGVTGEEGDQVAVEYRVNRYLSVQTNFGGTQQSGIDVFWRYDFGK